jgi:hypothetical protein
VLHQRDRADASPVDFGDPARFAPRIETAQELRRDLCHHRLEPSIPAYSAA